MNAYGYKPLSLANLLHNNVVAPADNIRKIVQVLLQLITFLNDLDVGSEEMNLLNIRIKFPIISSENNKFHTSEILLKANFQSHSWLVD